MPKATSSKCGACRPLGVARDVGRAVVYLASDDGRYVTGTELAVDGGITLKYV